MKARKSVCDMLRVSRDGGYALVNGLPKALPKGLDISVERQVVLV